MSRKFDFDDHVRNFYGEADHTIRQGLLEGKGHLEIEKSYKTNFKPQYGYVEGLIWMPVDGRKAKKFAKDNNMEIVRL